jgi:predicted DNA-binding transcriptional regulator AlpA
MPPATNLKVVAADMVTVRTLAHQYGMSKSAVYELIKSDPTFPYKNVGLKKKLMVSLAEFENWVNERTEKQKETQFNLPSAMGLWERFSK